MTEERKRLFISIGAAVLLHAAVLILTGMNALNFESQQEFGPITVEISMERSVDVKQPEPEPVEDLADRDVPDPVGIPEEPAAEPVEAPVPEPVRRAAPAERDYTPAEVPDDTIASIRSSRSTASIANPWEAFGEDPVAPTNDSTDTWQASGSHIVPSDVPVSAANAPIEQQPAVSDEKPLIGESAFSNLDAQLESGTSDVTDSQDLVSAKPVSSSGSVSGQEYSLVFEEKSVSRRLINSPEPELPDDIKYTSIPEYKVVIVIEIDPEGFISNASIITPSGNSQVDAEVRKAIRSWLFEPSSSLGGKKVRATLTYIIKKS